MLRSRSEVYIQSLSAAIFAAFFSWFADHDELPKKYKLFLMMLPFLLAGGTDTKHFTGHCPNCLRYTPMVFTAEQRTGIHGLNEHIDIDTLPGAVDFFKALIQGQE